MTIPFDRPLSDEEFILLGELLAGIPEPYEPMEADHLDGYLTALVCLPKRPPVGEWMLRVFDVRSRPEAVLADRRAQQDLEDLVFRRFNSIERDLKAGRPIDPIVYEPDEDDELETATIAALARSLKQNNRRRRLTAHSRRCIPAFSSRYSRCRR